MTNERQYHSRKFLNENRLHVHNSFKYIWIFFSNLKENINFAPKIKIIQHHFITMNIRRLISLVLLVSLAVLSFHAVADHVSATQARTMANSFVKSHFKASPGSYMAPAASDLVLAHAEPSSKLPHANVYYIFNIKGGGFVIVSGEDQAAPVLGYSDKGQIDVNNMSEPLKEVLDGYKDEIDYLLTHDIKASQIRSPRFTDSEGGVEPMVKTTWGPEEPYNLQCPTLNGQLSKVGCVGVCMAQTIYFWRFPEVGDSLPAYWSGRLNATVPALPATRFEYDMMILSYSHWNMSNRTLVQDVYTEEQAQAIAALCRYCGQSVKMNYSPSSSGATTGKMPALKKMGYSASASNHYRSGYTDSVWQNMMRAELDAGRLILYAANGSSTVGHAFIVDGYNNEDYFHMNMGWYGVNDGWYLISAIIFVNRYGEDRNYYRNHSMIIGMEPPLFCDIKTEIVANSNLLLLGETLTPQAVDVDLNMSYRTLPSMFSLTDAQGNLLAVSESITLNRLTFEQGSDIVLPLTLPQSLPDGTYDLHLNYRTGDNKPLTQAVTAGGQLHVLGKFAKYGVSFGIADVVEAIDHILEDESSNINIADVTLLIDYLLEK